MAVLQFIALYYLKPPEDLVLIVTHGYTQTVKLERYRKRFMEDWVNWFGENKNSQGRSSACVCVSTIEIAIKRSPGTN